MAVFNALPFVHPEHVSSQLISNPIVSSPEVVILSHFSQRGLRLIQHVFIFSNVVSAAHGGVGQNLAGNLDLLKCLTGCSSCVQLKYAFRLLELRTAQIRFDPRPVPRFLKSFGNEAAHIL